MPVPRFVRRATWRVLAGGAACALVVALAGFIGERVRFGGSLADARARIETDVREQFGSLSGELDRGVDRLRGEAAVLSAARTRDTAAIRALFDRLAETEAVVNLPGLAITVYGPDARPIAWAGRPATTLPMARITGPDALFLAQSPMGLRLTRVAPITDPEAPTTRAATIVAEAPLPGEGDLVQRRDAFVVATSVVPVPLRPGYEAAGDGVANAIIVRTATGEPLAAIEVPASEVAVARAQWQRRTVAAVASVVCVVLLLLSGPLLDWRRLLRSVAGHIGLTGVILALLASARAIAWVAVRLADLDAPALVPRQTAGPLWIALASPIDFLLTALALGALVALLASSFEQWRQSRRYAVHVIPDRGALDVAAFVVAQVAAGALVGALLAGYEMFLRVRLSMMPFDLLHFSLHPWEPQRLAVATGLVALHAALLALLVLFFRAAAAPWVVAGNYRWIRAWIPILWAAPAVAVLVAISGSFGGPVAFPAVLVVIVAIAAAWRLRRYRAALEHSSQAARLTAFFVALALPSLVFYPLLVDAAARARRQLIETRYAPEVINQRRDLQLQLNAALAQIDAIPDLPDLVRAGVPATAGPPSTDEAFLVWSRTVLENQRSTSIELYNTVGLLVSRFALQLPQSGLSQIYVEEGCAWALFEEVSPFFSEERILLHAGRGICIDGGNGTRQIVGSIAVHVTLDYSNLSFISAQSPYVALLRSPGQETTEPAPREAVEFTVYGWSRQPLYMSGRDAWPLPDEIFQRTVRSRDPFWATLRRGDDEYEVYFLNDRGAIYALGYPRARAFGHLINLAELAALAAATYLLILTAGFVYGLIAARTPTSGRELLREVRASFYRKLFIAFVAAAVVPVLVLAFGTRAYIATLMEEDLEMEATRTAASASRVVEDVGTLQLPGGAATEIVDDNLVVWLSRVIAQDVNIFDGTGLLASSERNLFASGLLPTRTQGEVYSAIILEGRPSFVGQESVGTYEYLIAAAPVRVQNREAILTVPLRLRNQEIEAQIDELDRRVLLAVVLFIALGAGIGYSMAERIADPVNRLMKATARIARGDLDARILATSSDEFRRLVEAFNRMAADLQRQRVELERTNRIAAWADMARQVAHDIKNPLTPIQLNAEHLRRVHQDLGAPVGPVLDECVTNILTQVRLLRSIAGEFSSFASSPTVRPLPSSLHDLISEVIEPYRTGLAGKVRIDVDVPPGLPAVMIDKAVLARALTNIIENALHAMPGGGALVLAAALVDDRQVELSITDSGVGMDRASIERIFEPYFSTRASGTGLGLTIAKRNVELNGGTIQVESERGKGTTVRITLPTQAAAVAS
jgi:signal transduction histidine kinase